MKKQILILIAVITLLTSLSFHAQVKNDLTQKIDSVKQNHIIYSSTTEVFSSTINSSTGKSMGGTARSMFLDFRVGTEGPIKNIGRKGKNLKNIIKDDPEAFAEFNKAYKVHLRKKRIYNTLEFVGYAFTAGAAVALFWGADNFETDGITALAVAGGAGVVVGFAGIYGFHRLTDKEMDKFAESIIKSMTIYNQNLIKNIK